MVRAELEGANGDEEALKKEKLSRSSIEIRFADLNRDIPAVTALFNQSSVIEHLAGLAPEKTPSEIDVKKYGARHPNLKIRVATEEEIKRYYKNKDLTLIVAVDENSKVVGTVTVEKGGLGITWAGVSRLAVSEDAREKGIGKKLLRSANAYIFSEASEGGLGCTGAQAGIIQDVDNSIIPQRLFSLAGYSNRGESRRNCVSWDNKKKRFETRTAMRVVREAKDGRDRTISPLDLPKIPHA